MDFEHATTGTRVVGDSSSRLMFHETSGSLLQWCFESWQVRVPSRLLAPGSNVLPDPELAGWPADRLGETPHHWPYSASQIPALSEALLLTQRSLRTNPPEL